MTPHRPPIFAFIRVHSWFISLLYTFPVLIVLSAACFKLTSPDVPLGLAWGRSIIEHHALPATNIFSHMNPDRVVLLDKWLFQVLIYLLHSLTGPAGLVCLRVALLAVALLASTKVARIQWDRTAHAWLAVIFAIALMNRCYVRAELITWAAIPLMLLLVPVIRRGDKKGWILLILLQAVWANSHGYWIVGPLLWLASGTGAAIQPLLVRMKLGDTEQLRPTRERLRLLIAAPVALASACLNPYGVRIISHPIRLALELRNNDILSRAVDDFGSPLEAWRRGGMLPFWACLVLGAVGLVAVLLMAKRRRLQGEQLGLLALGFVLGLPLYRNMTIMVICALPMIAAALRPSDDTRPAGVGKWLYATALIPALISTGLAFGGWKRATDLGARRPGFGWYLDRYPVAAAHWIARATPDAKLWNDFTEGGWLNWRLGEGHTYIDGNTDGYPLNFLEHYYESWRTDKIQSFVSETSTPQVALLKYGPKDRDIGRFLAGVSWLKEPVIGFADGHYCVILASPDVAPGVTPKNESVFRELAGRIKTSDRLAESFSVEILTAIPPNAPDDMYARSGRLAVWLYPNGPRAQAHYERTKRTTNERE